MSPLSSSRIVLLDVVHEVDRQPAASTRVERGEHAGLALGRDHLGLLEPGVSGQSRHVVGARGVTDVFAGDGRQLDPVLERLEGGVVLFRDLGDSGARVLARHPERGPAADGDGAGTRSGALQKNAAIHFGSALGAGAPAGQGW